MEHFHCIHRILTHDVHVRERIFGKIKTKQKGSKHKILGLAVFAIRIFTLPSTFYHWI